MILPVSEKYHEYAEKLNEMLKRNEIRTLIDMRNEKIGRKIRDAEMKKVPYMLIVGEKEMNETSVSVRKHGQGDLGSMSVEEFIAMIEQQVKDEQNIG
jgi:threonyl-tRNA synthetase